MESSQHLRSVTVSTPFTMSSTEVRRTLLVCVYAINHMASVTVVNVRESVDKLKFRGLNDFWNKLLPEGINDVRIT
jgi:hypothetical protein